MNKPYYISITLRHKDFFKVMPTLDAETLHEAQEKALYWYNIYNHYKSNLTPKDFSLNTELKTQDKRYTLSVHQYPF